MKVGRNERCPCGSGKKYKNCCVTAKTPRDWLTLALLAALIALAGGGLYAAFSEDAPEAPAGKVWSEEHGHYH